MGNLIKNILVFGGLALIGAVGYYLYVINSDGLETGEGVESLQLQKQNDQFVQRLRVLNSVDLSSDIFSDPRFNSFVEFSAPVEEYPVGRENPFEPGS